MPRKTRVEFPGAVYHLICRDSKTDAFSSSDGGNYTITQPRSIVVATATSGCNLRYTTNGTIPTQTIGTLVASGGTVTVYPSAGGAVLKVIAFKSGWTDSIVHSAIYYYVSEGGPDPTPRATPTATATATAPPAPATPTATATATATATPTATATATATPTAPAAAAATATATATPVSQVSTPTFNPDGGTWFITQQRTVTVTTSTIGANMRYTINGAAPTSTSGTLISASSGTVNVTPSPLGAILRVIAYKPGMIGSQVHEAVFYYENDNGGNSNMAQPIDGGPGGGGILIDGGDQSTINYDANGNLTKYKGWTYSYDAQNRLINAVNGSVRAQFYYDGKNRQIARNVKGVIRFNSWDGWELLEEYSSSLNVATGYLQGTTGVIKSWSEANTLYYHQDKLGSTTHVANASGQLVESYKYDLYGTPSYFSSTSQPINSSIVGVADLYAGERWIPELALYDLRNRFMSPELGRFLQPDPIGFQGDASNLYRYCGNDPVDRSDPSGLLSPTPGLMDVSKETLRAIWAEHVRNVHEAMKPGNWDYLRGGRTLKPEYGTIVQRYNGKLQPPKNARGGFDGPNHQPVTKWTANKGKGWTTDHIDHVHTTMPGHHYDQDVPTAEHLHTISAVGTIFDNGRVIELYVPRGHGGGRGGFFKSTGPENLTDSQGHAVPH